MKPVLTVLPMLVATLCAGGAAAGVVCMDAEELRAALIDWYQEKPVSAPVEAGDSTLVLWASEEGGTWSLVRTYDGKTACVVAQGEGWSGEEPGDLLIAQLD